MAKNKKFYFAVKKMYHQDEGFLDMLRYDGAKVLEVISGYIILEADHEPTIPRWNSFLITVEGASSSLSHTRSLIGC